MILCSFNYCSILRNECARQPFLAHQEVGLTLLNTNPRGPGIPNGLAAAGGLDAHQFTALGKEAQSRAAEKPH